MVGCMAAILTGNAGLCNPLPPEPDPRLYTVGTFGGSTYSFDEIRQSLEEAGFAGVKLLQSGERRDGLVEAFKP